MAPSKSVGQYTGFKDKNDKLIFEGDILKVKLNFQENLKNHVYFSKLGCWMIGNYNLFNVIHEAEIVGIEGYKT